MPAGALCETSSRRELVSVKVCQTESMIGRRTAALLCVLLMHALIIFLLSGVNQDKVRRAAPDFISEPITFFPDPEDDLEPEPAAARPLSKPRPAPARTVAGESGAITAPATPAGPPDTSGVDWPIEGKKSAARVLAREAEAERIAKMFAGPGGTWASLTKRQRSKLSKFRWKPGVDGLEYDEKGNAIYHLPNGCNIVNMMFFGCPIGKQTVHGDMFDNMREYFDEQRLPETNQGNGTEPEALRPAN